VVDLNLFALNRKPSAVNQRLRITSVLQNAFGRAPVQSEKELLEKLSHFPVCKNKREGKQLLSFGVEQRLLIPLSKNRRRFFESNERSGVY